MVVINVPSKPTGSIGTRHWQTFILFVGLIVCTSQKANMSVALVAMSEPSDDPSKPTIQYSTFNKGLLITSYYCGCLVASLPAGFFADKYGPTKVMTVGGVLCGLMTILFPYASIYWGFEATCATRVFQGFGQGMFYPSIQAFLSKWIIPQEREEFTWIWSGCSLGTIIILSLGGIIAQSPGGWPAIFYFSGSLSFTWSVFCFIFGRDSPSLHKTITKEEKDYIEFNFQASSKKGKNMRIPYKRIATSLPVWSVVICQSSWDLGASVFIALLPTFFSGVYGFDVGVDGLLSSLLCVATFVSLYVFSHLGGRLRNLMGVNFNRKFWNSVSLYGTAAVLLLLSFNNFDVMWCLALFTLFHSLDAAIFLGIFSNHLDLAPNYSGFLLGLSETAGCISSAVSPAWAGYVIDDEHSMAQWQNIFLAIAVIKIVGSTVFLVIGSTTIQPWNDPDILN